MAMKWLLKIKYVFIITCVISIIAINNNNNNICMTNSNNMSSGLFPNGNYVLKLKILTSYNN